MKKLVLLILGILVMHFLFAEEITGKVVSVIDGNTIEVQTKKDGVYKIQFFGIDCPEVEQAFGVEAKTYLEKLLLNKKVEVNIQGKDRWGNRLAIVKTGGNLDPRMELLKEGLAWTAERNPLPELEQIKEEARTSSKGLWQEENPTPPWQFRRGQTMLKPKMS